MSFDSQDDVKSAPININLAEGQARLGRIAVQDKEAVFVLSNTYLEILL
jgi:hypothetical protein